MITKWRCAFCGLVAIVGICAVVRADNAPAEALVNDLASADTNTRAAAVIGVKNLLISDPRGAPTGIYRVHIPTLLLDRSEFAATAEICLDCINGQPDRVDRLEYFLECRVRALLALGKSGEALSAAKSLYNVSTVHSTPQAIELVAQSLAVAHPEDPGLPRRFKLQQFAGATTRPDADAGQTLGEPILKGIRIDANIYTGRGLSGRNRTGQSIGHANLLLLSDQSDDALTMFEALSESNTATVRTEAGEGIARSLKAQSGTLGPANAMLSEQGRQQSKEN